MGFRCAVPVGGGSLLPVYYLMPLIVAPSRGNLQWMLLKKPLTCRPRIVVPQFLITRLLRTSQPAAASVDVFVCVPVGAPTGLAVISSPFLFISNLCFRSKPLTNSRTALPTAPGRLDASTLTVDSTVPSFRSR